MHLPIFYYAYSHLSTFYTDTYSPFIQSLIHSSYSHLPIRLCSYIHTNYLPFMQIHIQYLSTLLPVHAVTYLPVHIPDLPAALSIHKLLRYEPQRKYWNVPQRLPVYLKLRLCSLLKVQVIGMKTFVARVIVRRDAAKLLNAAEYRVNISHMERFCKFV